MWIAVAVYLGLSPDQPRQLRPLRAGQAAGRDRRPAGARAEPTHPGPAGQLAGSLLGQPQFRHKTRTVPFRIAFWAVVILHVTGVGAVAYTLYDSTRTEAVEATGR